METEKTARKKVLYAKFNENEKIP